MSEWSNRYRQDKIILAAELSVCWISFNIGEGTPWLI